MDMVLLIIMRKFFFFWTGLLLFLCSRSLPAQTDGTKVSKSFRHELGLAAGMTTGYGLGYRVWKGPWGGQLVTAPYKTTVVERYIGGITLLYTLGQSDVYRFFVYQSNQYSSTSRYFQPIVYFDPVTGQDVVYTQPTQKRQGWAHGLGLGYEVFFRPERQIPFGLSFLTGWGAFDNFERSTITVEAALLYKFRK